MTWRRTQDEEEGNLLSFTSEIKKELIHIQEDVCCVQAELAAIIRMNGVISIADLRVSLDIQTESPAIARRIYTLVKATFGFPIELLVRKKMKLRKNNVYIVRLKQGVAELLRAVKIEIDEDGYEQADFTESLTKECCKRAY